MKLTINEIAAMAQVSKGTVSKVLNGYKGIHAETRQRILELVDRLDFHQDSSARALALQKTGTIGLLIPHEPEMSLGGFYWSTMLSAISREAVVRETNLLVLTCPREGEFGPALSTLLKRGTVDGLIVGSELLEKKTLDQLTNQKVPFVFLGQDPSFPHFAVDINSAQGAQVMVQHMISQGYRKIGGIFGPEIYPYVQERYAGYQAALAGAGIGWTASFFTPYSDRATAENRLKNLLDRHPDMDALFVSSGGDFIFGVLKVLRERDLDIPKFGVGVFDDYPFFDDFTPRVSAVRQPLAAVGSACVTMLLQLVNGEVPVPKIVVLPTELVCRGSLRD